MEEKQVELNKKHGCHISDGNLYMGIYAVLGLIVIACVVGLLYHTATDTYTAKVINENNQIETVDDATGCHPYDGNSVCNIGGNETIVIQYKENKK